MKIMLVELISRCVVKHPIHILGSNNNNIYIYIYKYIYI